MAKHLSSHAIISVVRMHHPNSEYSQKECKNCIKRMLQTKEFKQAFRHYRPLKGQSKLIPFGIRMGWVNVVNQLGRQRARKRYK